MSDIDAKYLIAFAAVYDAGSVTQAAKSLHLTQPAVSYQLRMLERQFGAPLFERGGRALTPTPAARRLREICRGWFNELQTVRASLVSGDSRLGEPLRIVAASGFGRYVLFPFLSKPHFRHIRLELRFPPTDDGIAAVVEGRADVGFVYFPLTSSRLRVQPVGVEELVLVRAAADRTPKGRLQRAEAYGDLPFISYDESDYVFGRWFEAVLGCSPQLVPPVRHFEELEETMDTVAQGLGYSIVPDHVAVPWVRRRLVRVVRPTPHRCWNRIFAVTRSSAPNDPLCESIVRGLVEAMREGKADPSLRSG